jgi:predicted ArsR family transcriptional regulator
MWTNRWNSRFFSNTRGRILALLRGASRTVNEVAATLKLTDNAVRVQLVALERDGLVQQSGMRRGVRKPHYTYTLTPVAEQFFPKAYDILLNQVLQVLQQRLPPEEMEETLREVGRNLALHISPKQADNLEERVQATVRLLGELGGLAEMEQQNDQFVIHGASCPFAAVVADHPQVCSMVETLVAEITKASVQERCSRGETTQCYFTIAEAER